MRLGIPGDESIRIVAAELPPEYARELESEEYGDDGKRVSSEAVREALAFLEQLRRDEPALVQWLLDGHPNLSEDEHLRRFGEPYQSRRRGGRA